MQINSISKKFLNKDIKISGFIYDKKVMSKIIFLILQNSNDYIQIVINDKTKYLLYKGFSIGSSCTIKGTIKISKSNNKNLNLCNFEIHNPELIHLNSSKKLPINIHNREELLATSETVINKYRFLELRNDWMNNIILYKNNFLKFTRIFFWKNKFIEIDTPILASQTFEGANQYNIFSPDKKKLIYSLPQSPQIYKQLLINSNFSNYFQIAKCFRNEQLRSDRQQEFLQLDIEKAFSTKKDIINIITRYVTFLLKKLMVKKQISFKKMTFKKAMELYGCDTPDIRFNNFIFKLNKQNSVLNFFGVIFRKYINTQDLNKFKKIIYKINGTSLTSLKFIKKKEKINLLFQKDNMFFEKYKNILIEYVKKISESKGTIFIVLNKENHSAQKAISQLRVLLGKHFDLIEKNTLSFVWIYDFPLFSYDENTKSYVSSHHPFTLPKKSEKNITYSSKSTAYDLILNGYEVGGGSTRINSSKMQEQIFKLLKIEPEIYKKFFSNFLNAMNYGMPDSSGFALGIERFIMILLELPNIKYTIPFWKLKNGKNYIIKN